MFPLLTRSDHRYIARIVDGTVRTLAKCFPGFSEHGIPAGLNSSEISRRNTTFASLPIRRYNLFPVVLRRFHVSPFSHRLGFDPITTFSALFTSKDGKTGAGGEGGREGREKRTKLFRPRSFTRTGREVRTRKAE